jgi:hypothetical protein
VCLGNTDPATDIDCDARGGVPVADVSTCWDLGLPTCTRLGKPGTDFSTCCELPKCRGNANRLLDFDCATSNHVYRAGADRISMQLEDNTDVCCVCPQQTFTTLRPELAGNVEVVPGAFRPDPFDGGVCTGCPEGLGFNYGRPDLPDAMSSDDCEPELAAPVVTQTSWQEVDGKITRTYALAVPLGFSRVVVSEAKVLNPLVDMG